VIAFKEIPNENLDEILPFIKLLNPKTEQGILIERLNNLKSNFNYHCIGMYLNNSLIGISGYWLLNKLYVGKHIEPDNVIILPEFRNKKYGNMLVNHIHSIAQKENCAASELNVYTNNSAGIKFWINKGYRILGFHMQKSFEL
jgi:ribosomal protein S18 acetylase RimI-like enzyme